MSQPIPIAIIGATGYTGVELMRLLLPHPGVKIISVTSRQYVGTHYSQVFPAFSGLTNLVCEPLEVTKISKKIEAVFLCLPHHEAMETAAQFHSLGVKVLDLSADFRLKEIKTYQKWYGEHTQPQLLKEAVYGLVEIHRNEIKKANLVAVPGCYPTSINLALAPLLKEGLIKTSGIICDSKSGVSGAGRSAQVDTLFDEVNDSFKAYKTGGHRHTPEIEQELSFLAGQEIQVLFSPHLAPMDRGIFSTIYCEPTKKTSQKELLQVMSQFYLKDKFVKILPEGITPTTKQVRGTNFCHIGLVYDTRTNKIIILSAIDNLTKGASGQAVQCFNVMFGFDETTGLSGLGLVP